MLTIETPATFSDLLEIPRPERMEHQGRRWHPLEHHDAVRALHGEFKNRGIELTDYQVTTSHEGRRMVGSAVLRMLGDPRRQGPDLPFETEATVGWINANDSSSSFKLAMGRRVVVCSNGMCLGEITARRIHTSGLNPREIVADLVGRYLRERHTEVERTNRLWQRRVTEREAEAVFVEALRSRALGAASKVAEAVALWDEPPHAEFRDRNAFNLYQALNVPVKRVAPHAQASRLMAVHGVLERVLHLN
jgi:hypothetical protein